MCPVENLIGITTQAPVLLIMDQESECDVHLPKGEAAGGIEAGQAHCRGCNN